MTIDEWNYIYQKAIEAVKARLKKHGKKIEPYLFEDVVFNTTTEYFREITENNKQVPEKSLFNYLWSLSMRTSLRWELEILDIDQPYVDKPKALPINITKLQAQTPLGHLVLSSITPEIIEKDIQRIFRRFIRIRSFPASPGLISPCHSNLSSKDWIQDRLNDFKMKPQAEYFVYKWGIATEDFDPREYGLYRTERIEEVVSDVTAYKRQLELF